MDAFNPTGQENIFSRSPEALQASELIGWFSVSGDLDDFIYYGEPSAVSER